MKSPVETNLYFAKATQPVGNPWKTGWLTLEQATEKAQWFVQEWNSIGVMAEACVFYRDGNIASTIK